MFVTPLAQARVSIDGKDLTSVLEPRLISLRLNEKRGGDADQLDLELNDADGKLAIPSRGKLIRLSLGWVRGTGVQIGWVDKGSFTVDETGWAGWPGVVTVRGRSADLTGSYAKRRDTSYRQTTLGNVVAEVAKRHGLTPQISTALASIEVPVLGQTASSDMAMVRRLGRLHDAVATVKSGKLILAPIGAKISAGGKKLPGVTLASSEAWNPQYTVTARDDNDGVEAQWYDQDAGERKTVTSGGTKNPKRLRRIYANKIDAQKAVEGEHSRIQRAQATLDLNLALGRPDLYPDRPVTVSGFKAEVDARSWIINEVDHALDAHGGLTTALKLETQS